MVRQCKTIQSYRLKFNEFKVSPHGGSAISRPAPALSTRSELVPLAVPAIGAISRERAHGGADAAREASERGTESCGGTYTRGCPIDAVVIAFCTPTCRSKYGFAVVEALCL